MKKIKDIFSYSVGLGFVGLSCLHRCKYYYYDQQSKNRICKFYKLFLNRYFIGEDGYIKGEFFCKNYYNFFDNFTKGAHPIGLEEFCQIQPQLEEGILYEACQKKYLCMIPFEKLKKSKNKE